MLRGLLAACLLLCSSLTWAQREVPMDMNVAVLKQVELPYVKLSSGGFSWTKLLTLGLVDGNAGRFQLSRFVRIRDENDRFIILGRLNAQVGKPLAVKQDGAGVIREIWVLTEGEVQNFAERVQNQAQ
ncbi:hypothetical protein ACFPVS_12990 [Neisseria weixii]|uniref:Uncharacterized protein n=1 Tax=Neisseria weixii TaxID=1853276 RepID=A0A3N4MVM2_9NEIS|nr:hypothetical protein [Neisseria weixii]ATD65565.1 hypothetical protein CGZ65_10325 [Neisseria weixii]RPD83239.1 hypothetical protein EGK74_13075 [Neisseria weixii]RPD83542.1 hypothetical protein EGK75_13105 [Neisseria weixii]